MIYKQNNLTIAGNNGLLSCQVEIGGVDYPIGWNLSTINQADRDAAGIIGVEPVEATQTLDDVYHSKLSEINEAKALARNSTFTHDSRVFTANQEAKENILSTHGEVLATGVMPSNWIGAWMDVNNAPYAISTVEAWKAFYNSYYSTGLAIAAKAGQLSTQVKVIYEDGVKDDATKIAEISAVVW